MTPRARVEAPKGPDALSLTALWLRERVVVVSVADGLPRTREEGRLEAFEWLWWAVAVDAFATLDEMVANGESRAAALDALEGYCAWLVANIDEAVTFGRGWWEAAA